MKCSLISGHLAITDIYVNIFRRGASESHIRNLLIIMGLKG